MSVISRPRETAWGILCTSDNVNYVILSNNADKKFMSMFGMYQVIDVLSFEKLKNTLEMFPSKRVVFNESLSVLSNKEKKEIFDL